MVSLNAGGSVACRECSVECVDATCCANQGCDWKLSRETKSILSRSPVSVDKSFAAAVARAQNWIASQSSPATGFFKLEAQGVGVLPLVDAFARQASSLCGDDWASADFDDVFATLMDTDPWKNILRTSWTFVCRALLVLAPRLWLQVITIQLHGWRSNQFCFRTSSLLVGVLSCLACLFAWHGRQTSSRA